MKYLAFIIILGFHLNLQGQVPQVDLTDIQTYGSGTAHKTVVELTFSISEPFYIQSNKPKNPYYIPTTFDVQRMEGFAIASVDFVASNSTAVGQEHIEDGFYDSFAIILEGTTEKDYLSIEGILHYQACDPVRCFFPRATKIGFSAAVNHQVAYHNPDRLKPKK